MQFFIGLKEFDPYPVFDPSLFVKIRKRVGPATFDSLTEKLISSVTKEEDQPHNKKNRKTIAIPLPIKEK